MRLFFTFSVSPEEILHQHMFTLLLVPVVVCQLFGLVSHSSSPCWQPRPHLIINNWSIIMRVSCAAAELSHIMQVQSCNSSDPKCLILKMKRKNRKLIIKDCCWWTWSPTWHQTSHQETMKSKIRWMRADTSVMLSSPQENKNRQLYSGCWWDAFKVRVDWGQKTPPLDSFHLYEDHVCITSPASDWRSFLRDTLTVKVRF